jgi:hypothetical protein
MIRCRNVSVGGHGVDYAGGFGCLEAAQKIRHHFETASWYAILRHPVFTLNRLLQSGRICNKLERLMIKLTMLWIRRRVAIESEINDRISEASPSRAGESHDAQVFRAMGGEPVSTDAIFASNL